MMKGIWITTEELWRENDNKEERKNERRTQSVKLFASLAILKKRNYRFSHWSNDSSLGKSRVTLKKKKREKRNLTNIQARRRWRVRSPVSHKNIKQLQQNDNQCKIILPDWSVNIKRKITQWPRVEVEDFIYLIIYFFHLTSFRFSTVQFFTHNTQSHHPPHHGEMRVYSSENS